LLHFELANDDSASKQQSRGRILFQEIIFSFSLPQKARFPFLFLAQSEHILVGANCASNDMQISRSTWQDLCVVVWSSCDRDASLAKDLHLSGCASIANDESASNNSLGEFFFKQLFFLFLFSRTERTRFSWWGLLVE
jgi:hypothetical protein